MASIATLKDLRMVKGLKVVHLNVRSLVKKIDQLRVLMFGNDIDVLTISETWLKEHLQSKLFDIEGYDAYR